MGGIPAASANVLAVVVNITVTEPGASGYLEAYGKGSKPEKRTSIVNFGPNDTVPNVAIVRPGVDGDLTIGLFGQSGTAHVIVDVFGWFSTSTFPVSSADPGARLIPTTPGRVLDTRPGDLSVNRPTQTPLAAKETMLLPIRGVDGINPTKVDVVPDLPNVTGVLLNVVGITGCRARPTCRSSPMTSAVWIRRRRTSTCHPTRSRPTSSSCPSAPTARCASSTTRCNRRRRGCRGLHAAAARTASTREGRVVPLSSPYRTFDTRDAAFGAAPLGPGMAEDWSFAASPARWPSVPTPSATSSPSSAT